MKNKFTPKKFFIRSQQIQDILKKTKKEKKPKKISLYKQLKDRIDELNNSVVRYRGINIAYLDKINKQDTTIALLEKRIDHQMKDIDKLSHNPSDRAAEPARKARQALEDLLKVL